MPLDGQTLLEDRELECNGPPGRMARQLYRLPITPKGMLMAMATVTLREARQHERWEPVASIGFAEETDTYAVRLQIYREKSRPNEVHFSLGYFAPSGAEHEFIRSVTKELDDMSVLIEWLPEGSVRGSVGGQSVVLRDLPFKPTIFELSCSTGRFEFSGVSLLAD